MSASLHVELTRLLTKVTKPASGTRSRAGPGISAVPSAAVPASASPQGNIYSRRWPLGKSRDNPAKGVQEQAESAAAEQVSTGQNEACDATATALKAAGRP